MTVDPSAPRAWLALRRAPWWSAAALVTALALVALAAAAWPRGPELSLSGGAGDGLSMVNSRDGESLLAVGGMAPGDAQAGTVTVTNSGSEPGVFTLSSANLEDLPGAGGGRLSDRLQLSIATTGAPSAGGPLFTGALSALDRVEVGELDPGEARTVRFSVTFPDGGMPSSPLTGDNVYQGAQTSVGFRWAAVASSDRDGDRGRGESHGGSRPSEAPAAGAAVEPLPTVGLVARRQRLTACSSL